VQFSTNIEGPEDPILIPKLRHARLSYRGRETILKYFDMPVLQSLSYDHSGHSPDRNTIFRLPSSLTHLKILRIRVTGAPATLHFREMLMGSPELTEIFIDLPSFWIHDLMSSLIPSEDLPLTPKLEVLRLGQARFRRPNDLDQFQEMIRFRFRSNCEVVSRMRVLNFYNPSRSPHLREKLDKALREYMDEGLDISVEDKGREYFVDGHSCGYNEVTQVSRRERRDRFDSVETRVSSSVESALW
jgi:hypothetical protein